MESLVLIFYLSSEPNILGTMQAAEKLGIVYIGKAGGKVIFGIL